MLYMFMEHSNTNNISSNLIITMSIGFIIKIPNSGLILYQFDSDVLAKFYILPSWTYYHNLIFFMLLTTLPAVKTQMLADLLWNHELSPINF